MKFSHVTIHHVAKVHHKLELAAPKLDMLKLTPHHEQSRLLYAKHRLTLTDEYYENVLFGDEKGYGFSVKPNRQNHRQWCKKDLCSSTNVHPVSKYDSIHQLNGFIIISICVIFF